jgi:hypothetical protein
VNVAFADSSRKGAIISRRGFLLENVDDLANRQHCREYQDTMVIPEKTNIEQYTLMAMFQYMIGNTDWSISNYQNIKLLVSDTSAIFRPLAMPYDFDNSGLVDAEYALPNEKIPIETVRDRYNKAMALPIEVIKSATSFFLDKQPAIMDLVEQMCFTRKLQEINLQHQLILVYHLIVLPMISTFSSTTIPLMFRLTELEVTTPKTQPVAATFLRNILLKKHLKLLK